MKKYIWVSLGYAFLMLFLGAIFNLGTPLNPQLNPAFTDIFFHNLLTEYRTILLSIISLGSFSFVYLTQNFVFLGLILKNITIDHSFTTALIYILPHGFFEIIGIILTSALGMYIPIHIISSVVKKRKIDVKNFGRLIIRFVIIIFILTFISAIIEVYITPYLIKSIN